MPPVTGRRPALALGALLLALVAPVLGPAAPASAAASPAEQVLGRRMDHARALRGIPPLDLQAALTRVARAQAERMADRNRLFHNPDLATDVTGYRFVGENVGFGPDAVTLFRAFMASAPHRANILDRDYDQVGVGAVLRGDRLWVAVVFRDPSG